MMDNPIHNSGSGDSPPLWFPYPASKSIKLLPPLVLAYIGDAVFEVAVRQYLISQPKLKPHHLHVQATRFVSAKAQAKILSLIESHFTDEERDVVRQGRNAKSGSIPKNANVLEYRHATALEALIGFLYYSSQHERMNFLIHQGLKEMEEAK